MYIIQAYCNGPNSLLYMAKPQCMVYSKSVNEQATLGHKVINELMDNGYTQYIPLSSATGG